VGLLVQSGLGTGEEEREKQMEERESPWWRDEERRRESLMEERENKVTELRDVKLVMCNAMTRTLVIY
jgi:hypothetical protein